MSQPEPAAGNALPDKKLRLARLRTLAVKCGVSALACGFASLILLMAGSGVCMYVFNPRSGEYQYHVFIRLSILLLALSAGMSLAALLLGILSRVSFSKVVRFVTLYLGMSVVALVTLPSFLEFPSTMKLRWTCLRIHETAKAVEAYYEEHQKLPPWTNDPALAATPMEGGFPTFQERFMGESQPTLTSPTAFLSNYLEDNGSPALPLPTFGYYASRDVEAPHFIIVGRGLHDDEFNLTSETVKMTLDAQRDSTLLLQNTYDPTNGILSNGDIWVRWEDGKYQVSIPHLK